MSKTMKRATTLLVALAMSVGLCFGLAACSSSANSDETAIKTELDKALGALKNPTAESIGELMDDTSTFEEFEKMGVDPIEMLQHLFGKFDYTIDSVKVDGDTATAQLTLTNIDLEKAITSFTNDMGNDAEFTSQLISAYQSGGEAAMYELVFDKMYEYIDNSDELVTSEAELKLTKANGQWQIDENSEVEMISAMYGGADLSSL